MVVAAVALAVVATWPLLLHLDALMPAAGGDASLNAWALAWGADRLRDGLSGFWTPPIFHPYPSTLAYTENLLGIAIVVAPVAWAGGSVTLTYNVAFLLAYVVSAIGAYVLARDVTGSRPAAALGALAFVMLPYRVAQAGHLQVQWIGWMPIALWALVRMLRAPSWSMLTVLVTASILQALSNGYAAFQLLLAAVVVVVWQLTVDRRSSPRALGPLVLALGLAAFILAPVIATHQAVWGERPPPTGEIHANAADLGTYFAVDSELSAARWLPGVVQPEGRLFPGVAVLVLAVVALMPRWRRSSLPHVVSWQTRGLYVAIALTALLVSLGPEPKAWGHVLPVPALYDLLAAWVPLFQAVRVPARFGALVLLAVSMLAAAGAARVLRHRSVRVRTAAVVLAAVAIFVEGMPAQRPLAAGVPEWSKNERAAYAWLAAQPAGAVLELPIGGTSRGYPSLRYQHATLLHRHPTIDGLSRLQTPLQELLGGSASPLAYPGQQAAVLPMLQGLAVRYVVIRPGRFLDQDFGRSTLTVLEASDAVESVHAFGELSVLSLRPETPSSMPDGTVRAVPSSALVLHASTNAGRLDQVVDGNPSTRWLSGHPQNGHEWIEIAFDTPRDVARLDVVLTDRSLRDYPRHLRVESRDAAGATRVLYDGDVLGAMGRAILLAPHLPVMSIALPHNMSEALILRQTGVSERWYWSVDELSVWARP